MVLESLTDEGRDRVPDVGRRLGGRDGGGAVLS